MGAWIDPGVQLPAGASTAQALARLLKLRRDAFTAQLTSKQQEDLTRSWAFLARAGQRAQGDDWRLWLILAGRGFGKTRAGAEWVRAMAESHPRCRIALVGATIGEARAVMVEGESGILSIGTPKKRPRFEPSLKRLRWANGTQALLYSAAEPEGLRGAQHHFAWADEIGKWPHASAAWDNLMLGLRRGRHPRILATTTPRATALVRRLMREADIRTGGGTRDNVAHLSPAFLAQVERAYGGTRLGRQELDGVLLDDVPGALWSRALIERCRRAAPDERTRVVIGVDPPAGASVTSDACGIVVAALGADGNAYVLEDASVQGASPEGWARAVARAAARWGADRVYAEANNGGAMVESVLRAAEQNLPVKLVHAAHGKTARAEPVAALYEAGRAFHAQAFPQLEDEMAGLIAGGGYEGPGRSPDRADALVWAMHELMLGTRTGPAIRSF